MEKETKNETFKLRISAQEKASYKDRATKAGLNISTLIRAVMNTEGKLIFLTEGAAIAEGFCNCNKLLSHFMARGQLTDAERLQLEHHMEEITRQLSKVASSLTAIDADGEEDED